MRGRAILTIAGILLASSAWAQWNIQFVDNEGDAGRNCRVVNDLLGIPHVFYEADEHQLMHAAWTGSGWSLEHVLVLGEYISDGALDAALDRTGKWHLVVAEDNGIWGDLWLHYVTNATGSWTDTVLSAYINGVGTSYQFMAAIALDTAARPHIADYCSLTDQFEHRWKSAIGTWQQEPIESSTDIRGLSATVDPQNRVYVGYFKSGDMMMAHRDAAGVWGVNVVDAPGVTGEFCSLKLDRNNRVCISYYDATNGDLKYAIGTPSFK